MSECSCRDSVEAAADVIPTMPNEPDGHGMIAFSLLIVVLTIVLWRLCHRTKKEKNMLKGPKLDMLCPQDMLCPRVHICTTTPIAFLYGRST
jgi:hypothetical protein